MRSVVSKTSEIFARGDLPGFASVLAIKLHIYTMKHPEWARVHGVCTVRTILGNYTAFTSKRTLIERYWTATLAPRKQPGNGYLISLLQSQLNQDGIWIVDNKAEQWYQVNCLNKKRCTVCARSPLVLDFGFTNA